MKELEKESKSMFSSETLDSMEMAEVYGGVALAIADDVTADEFWKLFCKCDVKIYCPNDPPKADIMTVATNVENRPMATVAPIGLTF